MGYVRGRILPAEAGCPDPVAPDRRGQEFNPPWIRLCPGRRIPRPLSSKASCTARMTWKERLVSVGSLWDFPGTFGRVNGHEHETTGRPFPQVKGWQPIAPAGQLSDWSLPRHLTGAVSCPSGARGTTPHRVVAEVASQCPMHRAGAVPAPETEGCRRRCAWRTLRPERSVLWPYAERQPAGGGGRPPPPGRSLTGGEIDAGVSPDLGCTELRTSWNRWRGCARSPRIGRQVSVAVADCPGPHADPHASQE